MDLSNIFPENSAKGNFQASDLNGLVREYCEVEITLTTGDGTAECPTRLNEVLGLQPVNYQATLANALVQLTTDCTITSGAVTIEMTSGLNALSTYTARFYLVGRFTPQDNS